MVKKVVIPFLALLALVAIAFQAIKEKRETESHQPTAPATTDRNWTTLPGMFAILNF